MKKLVTILICYLTVTNLAAQTVQVNGTLRDFNGEPLPGATIVVKGTNIGTVADIDGNYTLEAPVGSTLIVSFIGFQSQEFEVTESGKAKLIQKKDRNVPIKENSIPKNTNGFNENINIDYSLCNEDTSRTYHNPEKGIAIMHDNMIYKIESDVNLTDFSTIKLKGIHHKKNNQVLIFENQKPKTIYVPRLFVNSSFSIQNLNRLPYLQHTYAQGRPILGETVWQGPESGELFAWGPALSTLEFNGTSYDFDKNGQLVPQFQGNATPAKSYNPYDFFKNGYTLNSLYRIEHRIRKTEYFISFKQNLQNNAIPVSRFNRSTLNSGISLKLDKLNLSGEFLHSGVKGKNASGSILDYYRMRSVLLTPPSFDNSNDNGKDASKIRNTYYTLSNEHRSSALNFTDNPYWLINLASDDMVSIRTMSKMQLSYRFFREAKITLNLHADNQHTNQNLKISENSNIFTNGVNDSRISDLLTYGSLVSVNNLTLNLYNTKITSHLFYQFSGDEAGLNRFPVTSIPVSPEYDTIRFLYNKTRYTQSGNFKVNMNFNEYFLFSVLGHQSWFSDIKNTAGFRGGAVSAGLLLSRFYLFRSYLDFINSCKIYGSFGNDYAAPPLLTDPNQYATTALQVNELSNFYPAKEIKYNPELLPENNKNINIGLDLHFQYNKYNLTLEWYKKTIQNAILPQYNQDGTIELSNLARLSSPGLEISLITYHNHYNWEFSNKFNFTKFNTIVEDLYNNESVPLAGFGFVSSNAIEGESLGIITGSKYLRDDNGNKIIDENGYPLVDPMPGIIGNPNPKFKAGLTNTISHRNLEFSVVWELKKGGDVWNGTRATLDYYGLSAGTESERNVRNYIFNGVTADGNRNTQPVDFANPGNSLESNRWVRYGITGVAEDYIEDGSWFRIQNLSLDYTFYNPFNIKLKELKTGIFVNNIILWQKYKGVDTESSLFSQPGGNGLDYFNMPSSSSFGISLEIKF